MRDEKKSQKAWLIDGLFFVLVFLGLATLILVVNVVTHTWNGISGHALATILAALALFKYRWRHSTPGDITVMAFSAIAGLSAIVYLYFLQTLAALSGWIRFEPLQGYELAIAFAANTLICSATIWVRRRSAFAQK